LGTKEIGRVRMVACAPLPGNRGGLSPDAAPKLSGFKAESVPLQNIF
jgi:hypothetical protein